MTSLRAGDLTAIITWTMISPDVYGLILVDLGYLSLATSLKTDFLRDKKFYLGAVMR